MLLGINTVLDVDAPLPRRGDATALRGSVHSSPLPEVIRATQSLGPAFGASMVLLDPLATCN
jgi:hypothetical protein